MPSGRVPAATTTEAIQEIEVYKATLALENMPGKQTLIAGTRIRQPAHLVQTGNSQESFPRTMPREEGCLKSASKQHETAALNPNE